MAQDDEERPEGAQKEIKEEVKEEAATQGPVEAAPRGGPEAVATKGGPEGAEPDHAAGPAGDRHAAAPEEAGSEPAPGLERAEPELGPGPFHNGYHLPAGGPGQEQGAGLGAGYAAEAPHEAAPAEPALGPLARLGRAADNLWATRKALSVAALVLLALLVAAAALLLPGRGPQPEVPPPEEAAAPEGELTRTLAPFIFVGQGRDEQMVFKVGLAVEFADVDALSEFDRSQEAVRRDLYDLFSRGVEHASLLERKTQLQEAVRDLINARLGPGRAVRVYFNEFLAV